MRNISEYSKKKASEHIYYEVWMFFDLIQKLKNSKDQTSLNINLDSYAVHLRNIFNFLYPPKHAKMDDIIVGEYLKNKYYYNTHKTPKSEIKYILRKADKQVSHLTYSRNKFSGTRKGWYYDIIGQKIYKSLNAFYVAMPDEYKKWPYFVELKKVVDGCIN